MSCIFNIGNAGHCDRIVMPMNAKQTGIHLVLFSHAGNKASKEIELIAGQRIEFDSPFNECGKTTFQILQPDSTYFSETVVEETITDCSDVETRTYDANMFCVEVFFEKAL